MLKCQHVTKKRSTNEAKSELNPESVFISLLRNFEVNKQ